MTHVKKKKKKTEIYYIYIYFFFFAIRYTCTIFLGHKTLYFLSHMINIQQIISKIIKPFLIT
jgi:hypothetical protein